jgi:hypothetical protein
LNFVFLPILGANVSDILKSWIDSLRKVPAKEAGANTPDGQPADPSARKADSSPTAAPQESKEIVSFEIGDEMRLLLSPEYIQIDSPHRMDEMLLRPFCAGSKSVILIDPQDGKITPATLHSIQPEYLEADIETSAVLHKGGERLLLVFPVLPKRQFVLQAVVNEMNRNRMKLQYQDPRFEERWSLQISREVSSHRVSSEALTAIVKEQVQIKRELVLASDRTPGTRRVQIRDLLYDLDSAQPLSYTRCFDTAPPFVCALENISLGGACLALDSAHEQGEFLNHLICLHISVPPIMIGATNVRLHLQPLAVIRNVRSTAELRHLHAQFLKRLPNELSIFFVDAPSKGVGQASGGSDAVRSDVKAEHERDRSAQPDPKS